MTLAETYIKNKLEEKKSSGTYRALKPENELIDFCSNDYLGFARSTLLKNNIDEELKNYPDGLTGATGSRLISGNLSYTEALEKRIAIFHQSEAGLIFNSGYDANIGLFASLPHKGDTLILDELIHASIIDGARLNHANRYTFRHNDVNALEAKLKHATGIVYVVIESIYSMNGDTPPIDAILNLTEQYGANLIVDEAHAVGLYPSGLITHLNMQHRVFARIVTFGKAIGCHGAIVLGSDLLRQYLINFARSFIYTTAAPFHQLVSIKAAYDLLETSSQQQILKLHNNINLFKKQIVANDTSALLDSDSAIQGLLMGSNDKAKQIASHLQTSGFDVRAILSPTVAIGTERIRICLHAYNTSVEITRLTATINKLINAS